MQSRSLLLLHVTLLPVYIALALYFDLIPAPLIEQTTALLRLARSNLLKQRLAASSPSSTNINAFHSSSDMSSLKFIPRLSDQRGHADHGWLKTFHTFSFASYHDGKHEAFGPLRVINEDRVQAHTGFGTHSHREFEIFSYVVAGQLEHKDSMGNVEILRRGHLQMTSAGTGISHSEKAYSDKQVHFLQIWSLPHTSRLTPKYYTRAFSDEEKTNKWARIVAPVGAEGVIEEREASGPAPVHSELTLYATLAQPGQKLEQELKKKKGYVHVVQTSGYNPAKSSGATVRIGAVGTSEELELKEGDGAYIQVDGRGATFTLENIGEKTAEVLLFDLE